MPLYFDWHKVGVPGIPTEQMPDIPLPLADLSAPHNPLTLRLPANWNTLPVDDKYDCLERVIGDTPIWELTDNHFGSISTKMELLNPTGSHYDRAFVKTLRDFEKSGLIKPGDELRDITSGNAGIALALLGQALGYKVRITVPDELPMPRLIPMYAAGAKVVNAGPGYIRQASTFQAEEIQKLKADSEWELVRPGDRNQRAFVFSKGDERICYLNHSENLLTPDAFRAIGEEAVSQMVTAPDNVILAMGNWTTIAGISPVIRKAWPDARIIGYEGENTVNHDNYGTTVSGIPLRFRDDSLLDEKVVVTDKQRDHYDQKVNPGLQTKDHFQLGHSSIMGIAAAHAAIQKQPGSTALTIAYDEKGRY